MDKRLQIDFSERAYADLENLQKRLEAPSKSEVIRTSLGLLHWFLDEAEIGGRLMVQKPDGSSERVVFPFLDRLARRTKPKPSFKAENAR